MTSKALALASLISALLLAACSGQSGSGQAGGPPTGPVEVGVITLRPQNVPITIELPGRVSATKVAEIRPQVDGLIQKRVFTEGGQVKAGDLLYQIDPRPYQAVYDAAAAALEKAQAAVPSAQAKVDRYNQLVGVNTVTAQSLDEAKAALAQAKADVAAAEAALATAQINLDYTKVVAPISGLISTSAVTEGALVTANQSTALATIREIDPINVDLTDSSTNLFRIRNLIDSGRLKRGEGPPSVQLKLNDTVVYDQPGVLRSTEAIVNETTGTFSMRASFDNPTRMLLPGMYVRAVVNLGTDEGAFLVPQRAVNRNAKGDATAMLVSKDGKVETRVLQTLQSVGSNWLIEDGISDGDRLIVDGLQKIGDGQAVTPIEVTLDAAGVAHPADAKTNDKTPAPATAPATGG
ncbi:MAG: efflux RND transporter periplasmic adaptor subunit [Rhizobiales bacterium]|nr:efflux RND transporter periplasmic adaptor subunit [Hyphomicrobiales bacterium]